MQPNARIWLVIATVACSIAVAACSSNQGFVDNPSIVKLPATFIDNPVATLQGEADKYLKHNRPLYIQPFEVFEKCVKGDDQNYLLVDIRNDEHYAFAHIPGSIHIAYADVWREQKINHLPKEKKIVVIDYSGHTASQVAAFWSMLGFDAIPMKNGMAGWSKNQEVIGASPMPCQAENYPVVTAAVAPKEFDFPQIDTKAVSLPELLMLRSAKATEIAPVIQAKNFIEKRGDYYVIDIRQPVHYLAGHIEGAVNIPFRNIAETENLKKIPTDKSVALICYDGHASSQAARLLNQMGYNTTVLKDGMSVWVSDARVIGAGTIACNITEQPVVKLNALLKPGPSTAAT